MLFEAPVFGLGWKPIRPCCSSQSSHHTHLFWLRRRVRSSTTAICSATVRVGGACVSTVSTCALWQERRRFFYLWRKKNVAVSPPGESLKLMRNRRRTRTPTYTCSFRKLESRAVVMETQVPRSYHLPTSQTLLYPSWHSAICSFGTERPRPDGGDSYRRWHKPSGSKMEAGHGGESEQVTADWTVMRWRGRACLCDISPLLCGFFDQPPSRRVNVRAATVFPHHRLWSASSVPGGLTSIMHLGSQTHAHNTQREHRVQSGDSEVKSIVCACMCVCSARLATLVVYWAILAQHAGIHDVVGTTCCMAGLLEIRVLSLVAF